MAARCVMLLTRKAGMSREEFNRHWLEIHGRIAVDYPHVIHYTQLHLVEEDGAGEEHDYGVDGIVDFVFDSREGFEAIWATEVGKRGLEDAGTFIEHSHGYFVDSHVLIDKEEAEG
jgi:uncharacterized protein (TIGR02118 family)